MSACNVLVVEDESTMRGLLVSSLRSLGVDTIREAANGIEALQCMKKHLIHLVFLDLQLPELDGYGVLEWVTAQNLDIQIIVVSANGDIDSVKKAISLGAHGFIVKPYNLAKVREVLNQQRKRHR